ncbi:hypothetical protein E4K10_22170 [Streptomyces sp. T1317-0309]|nr:hypothetical protein E4K10_22170 [Streptomyces sp. T1317-0309]
MTRTVQTLPDTAAPPTPEPQARRNRRRVRLLLWALVVVLLAGLGWILVTGLLARAELVGSRNDLSSLRTGMTTPSDPAASAGTARAR